MARPTDPPDVHVLPAGLALTWANAITSPPPVVIPGRAPGSRLARHPLLRCLAIYAQIPSAFALVFALFVLVNLALAAQQHAIGRAVTELQQGRAVVRLPGGGLSYRVALLWLGIIAAVSIARAGLQYAAGVCALIAQQELLSRLRVALLVHVQALSTAYHQRHGVGEIVTRATRDGDKVRDALVSFWRHVVETSLVVASAIGLVAWYAPVLAVGPLAATAVGLFWLLRISERLVALDRQVGAAFDAVNQDLSEGVQGVRVIKAFALEPVRTARFGAAVETFAAQARGALAFATRNIPAPQILVAFGQVWVLACGAYLVHAGRLPVGGLVASLLIMNTLVFRVETVGRVMQVFADARASAGRIMEILDAAPQIVSGTKDVPAGPLGFELDGVRVGSPGGDRDVLAGCSLRVAPGEIVAIVGAVGSGKSTLTALLPRLVDAAVGSVRIGSARAGWRDVREVDLGALRRRVHVVPQEAFLFSDTVAANLRLGKPDATTDDLIHALKLAAADDVVAALPDGLDTVIGDRGVTLSGGQRQRLTLARAFVGQPGVLVLDDATSALDAVTEKTILDNVRTLGGGAPLTTLLVASKLSTVLLADRVFVLAGGRVAAEGRHDDLCRTCTPYRELLGIDDAPHG